MENADMGLFNNNDNMVDRSEKNKEIYQFLVSHPVGIVSSVDPNNMPHAAVVYYWVNKQFQICFTTKQKTKKYDNLIKNDNAMFIVFDALEQITVQITAKAIDLSGSDELPEVFRHTIQASMNTSDAGIPPISKLAAGDYTAFRLDPVQIRMAVFNRPDPGGYEEEFETIDF